MAIDINGLNSNAANANRSGSSKSVVAPKAASAPDTAAPAKGGADTVQISAQAQSLNRISGQIGKEAPVNREKVEALKAAIANGSYKTDSQTIAKRMLDSDNTL